MPHSASFLAFLLFVFAVAKALSADPLKVGDTAPDFTLPCASQDTIVMMRFSDEVGKNSIVLAFYPADWSDGCTKEMCTMRDNFSALASLSATIFGISGDYAFSHRQWARHHRLPFGLLSDHNHEVAKAYSSYNHVTGFNSRTVYVVDRNGKISYVDLAYKVGDTDSFDKLKAALAELK